MSGFVVLVGFAWGDDDCVALAGYGTYGHLRKSVFSFEVLKRREWRLEEL